MSLVRLQLANLRNLKPCTLTPSPGINAIVGANASGKSALLEAIYLLGRGDSFRTSQLSQMIEFDSDLLWVAGQSQQSDGRRVQLGIEVGRRKKKLKSTDNWRTVVPNWRRHCRFN